MKRMPRWGRAVLVGMLASVGLASGQDTPEQNHRKREIVCLLVDGRPAKKQYDTAIGYLGGAVDVMGDVPDPDGVAIRNKKIKWAQLGDIEAAELRKYQGIFLCDVPRLSTAESERLEDHVRAGGGLVISLGPSVDVDAYNARLYRKGKGLLPVRLRKEVRKGCFALALTEEALKKPALISFAGAYFRQELQKSRINRFMDAERPAAEAKVRPLLSFTEHPDAQEKEKGKAGPGALAMLEWRPFPEVKGSGRVVLVTTSLDMEWGSLPLRPVFVPLVQELIHFVAFDTAAK